MEQEYQGPGEVRTALGSAVQHGVVAGGLAAGAAALAGNTKMMGKVIDSGFGQSLVGKIGSGIQGNRGKAALITGATVAAAAMLVGAFRGWGQASETRRSWVEREQERAMLSGAMHR
jgi:hypothetical protein